MSSVIGGAFNLASSSVAANANLKATRRTNEVNQEIAEQNLGFQKDALDYQKALQQKIFDREDSAYQRTVQDMRAAGMSPLAMQGTNSAGEAIQVGALNNQFQAQSPAPFVAPDLSGLGGIFEDMFTIAKQYQELKQSKLKTDFDEQTLDNRVAFEKGLSLLQSYDLFDKQQKKNFNDYFGTNSDMSSQERFSLVMRKMLMPNLDDNNDSASLHHPYLNSDSGITFKDMFNYHNLSFDKMANGMIDKFQDYTDKLDKFNKAKDEQGAEFNLAHDLLPLLKYLLN